MQTPTPNIKVKRGLPENRNDPGSFNIPVSISDVYVGEAMCDLGASISLMPTSTFERLERMQLVDCFDKVTMTNGSLSVPEEILEDVVIRVDKFLFPIDIVVLETTDFVACRLILGRDFLVTAKATFDMETGEVVLKCHDKTLKYKISENLGEQFLDAEEEGCFAQFTRSKI